MGGVDLDHLEARARARRAAAAKERTTLRDAGLGERLGRGVPIGEGQGARRHRRPAAVGREERRAALVPGDADARLAPGVGELDAGRRAVLDDEPDHPGERLDLAVVPDPHVGGRDPAAGLHAGGLDDHQAHAADGAGAVVDEVPVADPSVDGRVLAHGGHSDPVAQGHRPQRERASKRLMDGDPTSTGRRARRRSPARGPRSRSSAFSMPTETRMKPSAMPSAARVSGGTLAWVMMAGCSMRLSTPPSDSAQAKTRSDDEEGAAPPAGRPG